MSIPTVPEIQTYLGDGSSTYTAEEIQSALDAEQTAQERVCRVDTANYPSDLAEALKRRVARNLAMRALPLGLMSDEMGSTRLGSNDPEVRRLERPYRRLVVG